METYSFTGTLGRDDDAIIDVCLFEDLPFSQDYTVINQWRVGDIMSVLIDDGHLKLEEVNDFTKVMSVRVSRYYIMDIEALGDECAKAKLVDEYTVGVSTLHSLEVVNSHIMGGSNFVVKDMDQKIRDIKLKRIL
jgi:hypothetical protein